MGASYYLEFYWTGSGEIGALDLLGGRDLVHSLKILQMIDCSPSFSNACHYYHHESSSTTLNYHNGHRDQQESPLPQLTTSCYHRLDLASPPQVTTTMSYHQLISHFQQYHEATAIQNRNWDTTSFISKADKKCVMLQNSS
ncbi:hypothetical protein J6590_094849 [Homalodisca vitripennis]|nr:hypothetical protein J6590_094849 [Homalodisca vitripennis]